jgi:hypothetical protein
VYAYAEDRDGSGGGDDDGDDEDDDEDALFGGVPPEQLWAHLAGFGGNAAPWAADPLEEAMRRMMLPSGASDEAQRQLVERMRAFLTDDRARRRRDDSDSDSGREEEDDDEEEEPW